MKTILLILLALTISTLNLKAEPLSGQAKIDSLLAELPKAKGDTNEVKLLNVLGFTYYSINPDKGIEYAKEALSLAESINWKSGIAGAYNSLGVNNHVKSNLSVALDYYQRSVKINEEIKNINGIASSLGNIGNIYRTQSKYKKALEYYNKALKIGETLGNKKGQANNLGNIGLVYSNLSNYTMAIEYYNKALKINESIGNQVSAAKNLGNMGTVYASKSDFAKAMEYYLRALKINESIGNKNSISNNLSSLGSIYFNLANQTKAIEYHEKALKIDKELGNRSGIARHLSNIGIIYNAQSNYSKAIEYLKKALEINKEIGNKYTTAITLGNIASSYLGKSDYAKALEQYNESLKINLELGNKKELASIFKYIGDLYLIISQNPLSSKTIKESKYISLDEEVNLNKAIENLDKAIVLYEEIGELKNRSNSLRNLASAYRYKGNYKNADKYYQEHIKLKDSVFNQENNKQIAALEKAREDDVNRIKIEKQEVQLAAQESEKLFIIYSGIGIVAFVVAILALIAYQRKKSDKLLYNVLPISIAKRLKKKEHPISDHFDQASIIFIDIIGFTAMSKDSDPTDIVQALNKVFTHYDSIASKHGLEKIKTIGDCYMAAAGIPEIQKDNTLRAARMAIEVRDYMVDYYTDHGFKLDVRIGLDCGPVVAGVIGEKKFIYDMWSDAVNTASRMESTGQSGSVHISQRFKEAVAEFDEFEFIDRGEMEVKGKGKMNTFFMGSKIPLNSL